jgi:hypothetical protein
MDMALDAARSPASRLRTAATRLTKTTAVVSGPLGELITVHAAVLFAQLMVFIVDSQIID